MASLAHEGMASKFSQLGSLSGGVGCARRSQVARHADVFVCADFIQRISLHSAVVSWVVCKQTTTTSTT